MFTVTTLASHLAASLKSKHPCISTARRILPRPGRFSNAAAHRSNVASRAKVARRPRLGARSQSGELAKMAADCQLNITIHA